MKALIFNEPGNPEEVLEYSEIDKPVPGPNEVLVHVLGSPIHPADLMFIKGKYRYKPEFPQTAGLEGAGIIEAAGDNTRTPPGTLVAFSARRAWAEYITLPELELIILPENFPVEKSIQFCLNPFTAWGLLDVSGTQSGDWLLLTAGNSAVSKVIIQLARLRNIRTIAVVRNIRQTEALKNIGANAVLSSDDQNIDDEIKGLTGGEGVNAALEAVGGETGTMVLRNTAPFGRVIIYGLLEDEPVKYFNSQFIFRNLILRGFGIRGYLQSQTKQQREDMLSVLIKEMGKPGFRLPVDGEYSPEKFKEALTENSMKNREGKVIFKF